MISERWLKSLITAIHDLFCKKMDFIHYLVPILFILFIGASYVFFIID